MHRDPDKMTMEEREKEVAHLLGKGLLRRHRFNKRLLKPDSTADVQQQNTSSDSSPEDEKAKQ